MSTLNEKVRAIRIMKGLTQEQTGQALGTTKGNYNRIEKGKVGVSPTKLKQLAELFCMSSEEIYAFQIELSDALDSPQSELERLKVEIERLQSENERLRQGVTVLKARKHQLKPILQEVRAFFDNFHELILVNAEKGKKTIITWDDGLQEWGPLVGYKFYNEEEAIEGARLHDLKYPLSISSKSDIYMAVSTMQIVLRVYDQGEMEDVNTK